MAVIQEEPLAIIDYISIADNGTLQELDGRRPGADFAGSQNRQYQADR